MDVNLFEKNHFNILETGKKSDSEGLRRLRRTGRFIDKNDLHVYCLR